MPYKVNESRRHKIPRARYRVESSTAYDAALRRRGDLTVWVTPEERLPLGHRPSQADAAGQRATRTLPSRLG